MLVASTFLLSLLMLAVDPPGEVAAQGSPSPNEAETGVLAGSAGERVESLDSARSRYLDTYNSARWEAHGALHHPEAAVMMPRGSILEGREAVAVGFARVFGDTPPDPPAVMTPVEVHHVAEWAWERGTWGRRGEPPLGWYLIVWRRCPEEGWLASQVIYTSR